MTATSFRDQAGDLTQSAEAPGGLTLNEGAGSRGGARAVGEAIGGGPREGGVGMGTAMWAGRGLGAGRQVDKGLWWAESVSGRG